MIETLRYCGNTKDPRFPNYKQTIALAYGQTLEEAIIQHDAWLADKVIGKPQATETYTIAEMLDGGYVGVYATEIDEYALTHPHLIVDYGSWLAGWCDIEEDWIEL